jgi:hypothetical protein
MQVRRRVTKFLFSRKIWNVLPKTVKARYAKSKDLSGMVSQVLRGTWNPVGIRPDHRVRLNTRTGPIVDKYREGKLKRTPGGE